MSNDDDKNKHKITLKRRNNNNLDNDLVKYYKKRKINLSTKNLRDKRRKEIIQKANELKELSFLNILNKKYQSKSIKFDYYQSIKKLTKEQKTFLWNLFSHNMKELYIKSNWEWNITNKQAELYDNENRYIILSTTSNDYIGYCSFRYIIEDYIPVIYIYELQIDQRYKRQGYGSIINSIIEDIAWHNNFNEIMLTVFKANQSAFKFYSQLNYKIDETDPSNSSYLSKKDQNLITYHILSKKNPYMSRKQLASLNETFEEEEEQEEEV